MVKLRKISKIFFKALNLQQNAEGLYFWRPGTSKRVFDALNRLISQNRSNDDPLK